MAQDLIEYLRTHSAKGFKPEPHYFTDGDFLTYYFRNDRCYAKRIDDILTVFLSIDGNELVGCKIKGVKHILQKAGNFRVTLDGGPVQLGLFFFAGASAATDELQLRHYEQLGQVASEVTVNQQELQGAR